MSQENNNTKPLPALFEELEPRLLLSADGFAGLDGLVHAEERELDADGQRPIEAHRTDTHDDEGAAAAPEPRRELVFVDGGIEDHEALVNAFLDAANADRHIEMVVLDPERDGVAQITGALGGYDDLDAVHVLSHGDGTSLRLGSTTLSTSNVDAHAMAISSWAGALDAEADLLLYGCDLASGEQGRALIDSLATHRQRPSWR